MPDTVSSALQVALGYYEAWTGKDLDKAMTYISEDIVCEAPAGRIEGAEAYRAFMAPFVEILVSSSMIAAFGDDRTALVMSDTETVPVMDAPGAADVTDAGRTLPQRHFVLHRARCHAARRAIQQGTRREAGAVREQPTRAHRPGARPRPHPGGLRSSRLPAPSSLRSE